MVRFLENISIENYNTFGIDAKARYFFEFTDLSDLSVFLKSKDWWRETKLLFLGSGSNVLFTRDFDGLVLRPSIPGIKILKEDRQNIWVEAGAGEVWGELVEYCVINGFGGLENLSGIPGTVGAAPVQNIGAYGSEVGNAVVSVNGFDLQKMEEVSFPAEECHFGYRDSIFKNQLKGKYVVGSVVFKLDKFPEFNLSYGEVEKEVKRLGKVSLLNVRQAIINIRSAKLPDVKVIGNAGSFFKNPVVGNNQVEELKSEYPGMPVYPFGEENSKLAAGWLIEQCGWKGFREGDAGVHAKQALVLVNYGKATGGEILNLVEKIIQSVEEKFGVTLNPEVNIL
jgi:UDP-N-acetylmuramate dehydrogenase